MRIDRFLHCIRLVKSRTAAQSLIHAGHLRIDGKRVLKCAEDVRAGQVIALPLRGAIRILRVAALPTRRGPPAEALCHYEELGESSTSRGTSARLSSGRTGSGKANVDAAPPHGLAGG